MRATVVLYIDRSSSSCGACGEAADPYQDTHRTVPPGPTSQPFRAGCGARFTLLSSHYTGSAICAAATSMRPDLPWQRIVEGPIA